MSSALLCGALVATAVALAHKPLPRGIPWAGQAAPERGAAGWPLVGIGRLVGSRRFATALAGLAAGIVVGGWPGVVVGPLVAVAAHRAIGRLEPAAVRRRRLRAAADLPLAVDLLVVCLAAGRPIGASTSVVATALGGPLGDDLGRAAARIELGADPIDVWSALSRDSTLGPLARALTRALDTGAPLAESLRHLVDDLRRERRAVADETARRVAIGSAGPLGLCFLPAFILVGIVPTVIGAFGALRG